MKKIKLILAFLVIIGVVLLVAGSTPPAKKAQAAVPYPVPHRSWIKLGVVAYQGTMTPAQIDWAAKNIDWFDSPDAIFLPQYKAKTNALMLVYDNYYCLYVGGNKWNAMVVYAAAHSITVDSMLIHYSQATTVTLEGDMHTLAAGSRIPTYGWYGTNGDLTKNGARIITNPGSAAYRAFNAQYEHNLTSTTYGGVTYDGIFVDNGGPGVLQNQGNVTSGGAITEYPGSLSTAADNYDTDLYTTFDAAKIALESKIQNVNLGLPWTEAYSHIDQAFEEYKIQPDNGGFSSWGNFGNWLSRQAEIDASGVASVISAHGLGQTATDSPRQKLFALAAYYIGANPSLDYFCRQDLNAGDPHVYGWFGAIEYNVGSPQATYTTIASGTDSNGNRYTIYGRQYTNALMLARVSNSGVGTAANVNISLPTTADNPTGRYYQLNADGTLNGTSLTQITLDHAGGAILIKESALSHPSISKTVDKTSGTSGDTLTYTISYSNPTANTFTNAKIEDNIPSGTTYIAGSATNGATFDGSKVILNIGNLAAGASGNIQFQVRIQ